MRACLLLAAATLLAAADPTERDPWRWPFARTSCWNTPIGSGARYVAANLPAAGHIGFDAERHIRLSATDPVREVYPPSTWEKRWPGQTSFAYRTGVHWRMPVPDALIIPDAAPPNTPNECAAFLMPDGRELRQLEPACRVVAGAQIVGWPHEPVDLYGDGHPGTHWGSGLSALGGSIRLGEMASGEPLRHALKINLWGRYLHYDTVAKRGWRWPANRNDSYAATSYLGTNPALKMGSLLAIPPATTAAALNVTTVPGRKLFAALQDYGAYISDDSAWDAHDLCGERGVVEEVKSAYGLAMTGSSGALVAEINRMVRALQVVDNNAATSVGGGGTPRRPLAPPLADPAFAIPGGLSAAGPAGAVVVRWSDPAGDETGFEVQRRASGGTWASAAGLAANVMAWTDAAASAGITWQYRVRLVKGANVSAWSATVSCTPLAGLPAGWSTADIGAVAAEGSATIAGGVWTLRGSGADIWGAADEFRFAWLPVTGDVRITATVSGLTATHDWAKAGVMVRESGAAGSRHALMCVTRSRGTSFQRRTATGGTCASTAGPKAVPATPYRVRIERIGDLFIGSVSADGVTWKEVRRQTIAMTDAVRVGLALTSHADGTLATAGFADVEVIAAPAAAN